MLDDPKAPSLLSGNIEASQQFRDDIDQLMAQMFGPLTATDPIGSTGPTPRFPSHDTTGTISPAIDIHETRSAFVLTAELPGLTAQDLEITLAGGYLILRGQKPRGHD